MHTAAGIWPDCRLETNSLCWCQTVGRRIGFSVPVDINSNVVDIYFLVWSLSRLLCCVGSASNVAVARQAQSTVAGVASASVDTAFDIM